jgi:hypothetical protein
MVYHHHQVQMPFVQELFKYIDGYFVETGTYQGETTLLVHNHDRNVNIRTLELSEVFYRNCQEKFSTNPKIEVFHSNSKTDLFDCIKDIDANITFWLDGHWSGVPNVGCDSETKCPVLFELDQINQHPIKTHTIMVDDIRLMDNDHFPVTTEEIVNKIYQINPKYTIRFYDDMYAKNDVLVAYIPGQE